ncbi:MAG: hypothetical protein LBG06_12240 [Deltaproteobacteria bacterium]|nr:hypothetical protein [Deltaproteobacteria bacterium]
MQTGRPPVLLVGKREISNAPGFGLSEVARLLKTPGFPATRHGGDWIATRSRLELWAEAAVPPPGPAPGRAC